MRGSQSGKNVAERMWGAVRRSSFLSLLVRSAILWRSCASPLTTMVATGNRSRPASVNSRGTALRSTNAAPAHCSKDCTRRLSPGWETLRASAAFLKLRVVAMAKKSSSQRLSSMEISRRLTRHEDGASSDLRSIFGHRRPGGKCDYCNAHCAIRIRAAAFGPYSETEQQWGGAE